MTEITTNQILKWLREGIDVAARSGYDTEARVLEDFEERIRDEFHGREQECAKHFEILMGELRAALDAQRAAEKTWTEKSTNDRIDDAFAELQNAHGIVALQNAGYTMSDGWSDVHEAREEVVDAWGAVFFHGQDVERGVHGAGLMLAFGAFTSAAITRPRACEWPRPPARCSRNTA